MRQMLGNAMTLPVLARVMRMVLGAAGFTDTADVPDIIEPPYKTLPSNSLQTDTDTYTDTDIDIY